MKKKSKLKKILIGFSIFFVLSISLAFLYIYSAISKSITDTQGQILIHGLTNEVSIIRDQWGIPHISTKKNEDAYFALGYVMAQDRLWQMDLLRKATAGRLSEILPKDERFIKIDRYFKTLCIRYYSKKTLESFKKDKSNDKVLKSAQRYVDGINFYIQQNKDRLPIEFKALGYEPEPFTLVDSMSIGGYLAVGFNPVFKVEIHLAKLAQKIGLKKALEIYPDYSSNGSKTIPNFKIISKLIGLKKPLINNEELLALPIHFDGSNAWVVSGKRSVSGKPLLANDPHLLLHAPSIFYEAHIKTDEQNFSGFFIPLMPFGLIGHNESIAWGVTTLLSDACDFYVEKIKKEGNKYFYLYKGEWKKATIVEQSIIVKGEDEAIPIKSIITEHGPIISSIYPGLKEQISIKWTFYDPKNRSLKSFYLMNHAQNWDDFKKAVSYHRSPGINVVYGDVKGNIGYYSVAAIPIRAHKGDGLLPMDGTTGKNEWQGYVPFDKQPHVYNPKEGFIVSANNKIVGDDYPYYISRYWEPKSRADRITELLNKKKKLSIKDYKDIQMDNLSNRAKELVPYLLKVYQKEKELSDSEKKALKLMKDWDYHQGTGSIPATIYNKWYFYLLEFTLKEKLGKEDFENYCETRFPDKLMTALFQTPKSWWFDDPKTKVKENRDDIIRKAFRTTIKKLRRKLGKDISKWQWGKTHRLTIYHPFGVPLKWVNPLGYLVNIGPFPMAGGRQSINKAQYFYDLTEKVVVAPAMRMIVDLSDISHPLLINSTGQSGVFSHRHYKDQTKMWLKGEFRKSQYDKNDIEKNKESVMILKPS